ncbi:MAG: hypothetical protein IT324_04990 [Anaerolineae bacterium]|nr:hypothetical protein [Anaerolineae bacterium]
MSADTLIVAVAGILAAILGALVPIIIGFVNSRRVRKAQMYKFGYVKVYHLSNNGSGKAPIYQKYLSRLGRKIDVFDEYHFYKLNIFREPQKDFIVSDRSSGIVDMQIIHPWQQLRFSDKGAEKNESVLIQGIQQESSVFFMRTIYYNAIQPSNEDFGMKMERDTQEARLLVDFSSIPEYETFLKGLPKGVFRDGHKEEQIGVIETQPGVFMATRTNLKKDDVIRIDFTIDWAVIDKQAYIASNPQ